MRNEDWNDNVKIALGIVLGFVLCPIVTQWLSSEGIFHWIGGHASAAIWAQAVGSILVVVVAVCVPYYQRAAARNDTLADRRLKARGILMLLQPELLELTVQVERAARAFVGPIPDGSAMARAQWFRANGNVKVQPLLRDRIEDFHHFGEPAGLTLMQMTGVASQYQRLFGETVAELERGAISLSELYRDPRALDDRRQALTGHLQVMTRLSADLARELAPFDIDPTHS